MRCLGAIVSGFVVGLMAPQATAEPVKILYTASVAQPEVDVWARPGKSQEVYPTNRLRRGDKVKVVQELKDGWLAILPPPESFSWINTRFVKRIVPEERMWVVITHPDVDVPVLMGSELTKGKKPTIIGARVKRGAQLRSIAPSLPIDGENWLAVEPPARELRYIQKQALQEKTDVAAAGRDDRNTSSYPKTRATPESTGGRGTPGAPKPGGRNNPVAKETPAETLWLQGKKAEQAGKLREAAQLYRQYGRAMEKANRRSLALQSFNYADYLDRQAGGRSTPSARPGTGNNTTPLPAGWVSRQGWLSTAYRSVGGRRGYVLRDSQGQRWMYAVPDTGLNLQRYVNQVVEVRGNYRYSNDLRAHYLVVRQIRPLR